MKYPAFKTSTWKMDPPTHLAPKVNRTCIQKTYQTIANKEVILSGLLRSCHSCPPKIWCREGKKNAHSQFFLERGLFVDLKICNLWVGVLFQHTSKSQLRSSQETREASENHIRFPFALLQVAGISLRGSCTYVLCPTFCGCHLKNTLLDIAKFWQPTGLCLQVSQDCRKQTNS